MNPTKTQPNQEVEPREVESADNAPEAGPEQDELSTTPEQIEVDKNKTECNSEVRKTEQRSSIEPREIALTLRMADLTKAESILKDYFTLHKDLYDFEEPAILAHEVILIEEKLSGPFVKQISLEYSSQDEAINKKIDQGVDSIRTSLFGIILSGLMKGEKLTEVLGGGIKFSKVPGSELKGVNLIKSSNIFAYCEPETKTVYIYENFFMNPNGNPSIEGQEYVMRHEIGHLLIKKGYIFSPEEYTQFLKCVLENKEKDIQNPHLRMIAKLLNNPMSDFLWNSDIRLRLSSLRALQGEDQGEAKLEVAEELAAETVAYYLESSNSPISYLETRLKFVPANERVKFLFALSGKKTVQEFKSAYNFDPTITPEKLMQELIKFDEFSPLFEANDVFYQKLSQSFENRGENLQERNLASPDQTDGQEIDMNNLTEEQLRQMMEDGEFEEDLAMLEPPIMQMPDQSKSFGKGSNTNSNKGVGATIVSFWEALTGKRSF